MKTLNNIFDAVDSIFRLVVIALFGAMVLGFASCGDPDEDEAEEAQAIENTLPIKMTYTVTNTYPGYNELCDVTLDFSDDEYRTIAEVIDHTTSKVDVADLLKRDIKLTVLVRATGETDTISIYQNERPGHRFDAWKTADGEIGYDVWSVGSGSSYRVYFTTLEK